MRGSLIAVTVGAWAALARAIVDLTVPSTPCPAFAGQTVESVSARAFIYGDDVPETIPPSVAIVNTTGVLTICASGA